MQQIIARVEILLFFPPHCIFLRRVSAVVCGQLRQLAFKQRIQKICRGSPSSVHEVFALCISAHQFSRQTDRPTDYTHRRHVVCQSALSECPSCDGASAVQWRPWSCNALIQRTLLRFHSCLIGDVGHMYLPKHVAVKYRVR